MLLYALQRIGLAILICVTSMVMLFSALKLIPGDPATIMLGSRASAEMKARITEELGLNDPIPVQLGTFFGRILQGNLGTDMWSQRPVTQMVLDNLPYTLVLIAVGPRLGGAHRHSAGLLLGDQTQFLHRQVHRRHLGRHDLDSLLRRRHLSHPALCHRAGLAAGHRRRRTGQSATRPCI